MLNVVLLSLSISSTPLPPSEPMDSTWLSAREHVQEGVSALQQEMQATLKAELASKIQQAIKDAATQHASSAQAPAPAPASTAVGEILTPR